MLNTPRRVSLTSLNARRYAIGFLVVACGGRALNPPSRPISVPNVRRLFDHAARGYRSRADRRHRGELPQAIRAHAMAAHGVGRRRRGVAVCLAVGFALISANREFPQREQELFEGLVALLATAILTSMVFWMQKAARS